MVIPSVKCNLTANPGINTIDCRVRFMKQLSASETSVLALIASSSTLSPAEYKMLFAELSPDAQEVAAALFFLKHQKASTAKDQPSEEAQKTARALLAVA